MRCEAHTYERIKNKEKGTFYYKCRYCKSEFKMNKEVLLKKPHCGCRFVNRKKMEQTLDNDKLDDLISKLV